MLRNMGLHDLIGYPTEKTLPTQLSPYLLLHTKSSIKFSNFQNSAQKGMNVSVTTFFIPLYYFQNTQIPMLLSERFTSSMHDIQPPLPHCKPHPYKQLLQESSANCQMIQLLYRKYHCLISETESCLCLKHTSEIDASTDPLSG